MRLLGFVSLSMGMLNGKSLDETPLDGGMVNEELAERRSMFLRILRVLWMGLLLLMCMPTRNGIE